MFNFVDLVKKLTSINILSDDVEIKAVLVEFKKFNYVWMV